jgi:hypothetical protein
MYHTAFAALGRPCSRLRPRAVACVTADYDWAGVFAYNRDQLRLCRSGDEAVEAATKLRASLDDFDVVAGRVAAIGAS